METNTAKEIIECLPDDRTLFYYFKDRYCPVLLKYYAGQGKKISDIKSSRFSKLLNKPIAKKLLSNCGNGFISANDCDSLWDTKPDVFALTLSTWGGKDWKYHQTSRPGVNLVLQLNFSNKHDQIYKEKIKPCGNYKPFDCCSHPTNKGNRNTLAWARIDIDFNGDEALIEEIQNDWIRYAKWELEEMEEILRKRPNATPSEDLYGINGSYQQLKSYVDELNYYLKIWPEAMLTAAISFIKEEIGINNIYYHSFETGAKLKHIGYTKPPKSLYTKLPEQFCFTKTKTVPKMLETNSSTRRILKKIPSKEWYQLNL